MNTNNKETSYQTMRRRGVNKCGFFEYCGLTVTSLGLEAGMTPRIAQAPENRPRTPIIWIRGLEYTCCTEPFIHSSHPPTRDVILSLVSLGYDDTLVTTARIQAEEVLEGILNRYHGRYILAIEDNPPLGEQGMFCISSGHPFIEKLKRAVAGANVIIAWGICTSWGCMQATQSSPAQTIPIDEVTADKPTVRAPSCLPIPDVMSAIITYLMAFGRLPELDHLGHPLVFCGQHIRDRCYRRTHFNAGESVESWDDNAARQGYCLYRMSYKGPATCNAYSTARWNGGVSFPIQSGHSCLGYLENDFQDRGSFYSRMADILQIRTYLTADTVGLTALSVVTAGVNVHTVASTIDQHRHRKQQLANTGQWPPDNKDRQA